MYSQGRFERALDGPTLSTTLPLAGFPSVLFLSAGFC